MKKYQQAAIGLFGSFLLPATACAASLLGSAETYAVLGGSTVTNTGSSVINGDLGVSIGSSVTGFPPGILTGGVEHVADASASGARADALSAYNTFGSMFVTSDLTGQDLGGMTLTSGVYNFSGAASLTGTLSLSGTGTFVFLISSTLTTGHASNVDLIGGANFENVFFKVGSSATLGTASTFSGTIIADQSVTATTGADVTGRLIALTGAVTLDTNTISAVPEPSSAIMAILGAAALLSRRRTPRSV